MKSTTKCLLAALLSLAAFSVNAQVSNDDCTGAIPVSITANCDLSTSTAGTTVGADPSGIGQCYPDANDVWYSFVATASAHSLNVFNVYMPNISGHQDFFLEVFSGACGAMQLQHQYCVEQYYGIEFIRIGDLVPGNTYFIRVGNPDQRPVNFHLCVGDLYPPPANDACADAIALPVSSDATCASSVAGTTASASNSPLPPCANCFPDEDVWYTFTATNVNQVVTLSDINSIFNNQGALVSVSAYSGGCGNLVGMDREVSLYSQGVLYLNNLNISQTYYLRVFGSFNNSQYPVTFNICVSTPLAPANDNCSGAEAIVPETGFYNYTATTGSLYGATASGTDCQGGVVNDVWYKFTATSPTHRVVVQPIPSNGNLPLGMEVYGGDCSSLNALVCKTGTISQTVTNLMVGTTYYLRIFSKSYTDFEFQAYVLTLPPPPANDECTGAQALISNPDANSCDEQIIGNTLGATSSLKDCLGVDETHDVWYSFVATSVSQLLGIFETNTLLGSYEKFGFEVFSGDCNNLNSLGCKYFPQYFGDPKFLGGLTPGATYFVRVFSNFGSNHEFSICLQPLPSPPVNSDCAQSIQLTSNAIPDCSAQVSGNTAGVVAETPTACNYQSGNSLWYAFTASSLTHVVEISDVQKYYYYSFDYWAELYEGTDCGDLHYLSCYVNANKFYLNNLTIGKTYYLRWVSGKQSRHSFKLCLSHFPSPPNDACANAQLLYIDLTLTCHNPMQGTTAGSAAEQTDACITQADVWYTFYPSQTTLRIAIDAIKGVESNTGASLKAELLTGDCGSLEQVYCWSGTINYSGELSIGDLVPGKQYFLRFASPDNTPVKFNVCLLTPPPPPLNDNCATPALLTTQLDNTCLTQTGYTTFATPSPGFPLAACCKPGGDLWYTFMATQADINVSFSNIFIAVNNSTESAIVELYGSICPSINSPLSSKLVYSGTTWTLTNLIPGTAYYLRIYAAASQNIRFDICISAPTPPVNDECAGALPLLINDDFTCDSRLVTSTAGATQSQPNCSGGVANDIWYQFTASTQTYRFQFSLSYSSAGTAGYEILSGDCGQLTTLTCAQGQSLTVPLVLNGFVPGNTYYLRLYSGVNEALDWYVCTISIPAPPANDACADATVLPVNPEVACTTPAQGSTLGANTAQPNCFGDLSNDIWYSFTATSPSQLLRLSVSNTYFQGSYFIGCQVLAGDCDHLTSLFCLPFVYNEEQVLSGLTPSQTYFIQVFSYGHDAHDFSICLSDLPQPANDDCANATTVLPNPDLDCNLIYPGTTVGANYYSSAGGADVWYTFTATSTTHFIELNNAQTAFGRADDLYYRVYHGSDCTSLLFLMNFQAGSDGKMEGLQPGETYMIQVISTDANSAYTFDLCIKSIPVGLLNIDCASAIQIMHNSGQDCDIVTHVSTAGAPITLGMDPECGINWFLLLSESWYSFTATSPNHQIELSHVSGLYGNGQLYIKVYMSDACVDLTRVICLSSQQFIALNNCIPGMTYSIQVMSESGSAHEFDLCIKTDPIPPNDLCENAIVLPVSAEPDCATYTAGTTLSANGDVWYSFTATQSAHTIWVDPGTIIVGVYGGNCNNLQNLVQNYVTGSFTMGDLVAGNQYLIQVIGDNINFNVCVSTPPTPPANDACAGAIDLPVYPDENCLVSTTGTNENATLSSDANLFSGFGVPAFDVWYTFTALQANQLIHIDNVLNPSSYLVLDVYSGTCGAMTLVGFIPTYNGPTMLLTHLTPGEQYYVRVYDNNGNQTTFDLCVTSIPTLPNDECSGALPLTVNPDLNCLIFSDASSFGATQSVPGCSGNNVNDIWFQFVASTGSIHLDITSQWSGFGAEILEGDCNAPTVVMPCIENTPILEQHGLTVGNTYFLRLYTFTNQSSNFTICLSALPDPPANDACAQAITVQPSSGIDCDQLIPGSTLGATGDLTSCYGYNTNDLWYQFVATGSTHLSRLKATDYFSGGSNDNLGMQLYEGSDCDNLNPIYCSEGSNGSPFVLEGLIIGNRYFIRVFSTQGTAHHFTLCISTTPPPPANVECAGAVTIVPSPDMQCGTPVTGSFAGIAGDFFQGCNTGASLWYHFAATANEHFIQLQDTVQKYGDPFLGLELYAGTCGGLQLIGCPDQQLGFYAYFLNPGQDYYIRIAGGHGVGTQFDLCVLTVVAPANGTCENAQMLPVSPSGHCAGAVYGSTLGAPTANTACDFGPSVFYSFVATGSDHVIGIRDRGSVSYNNRFYFELLEGPCDNYRRILSCEYPFSIPILRNLAPGQTYYIKLTAHFPGYLNFDICVATPQPSLVINSLFTLSDGCKPGNNEAVGVNFSNWGSGSLAIGQGQFTLTVSGANNGVYGPISNPQQIGYYSYPGNIYSYDLTFSGVNLSNPGDNQLTVSATYPYDEYPNDHTLSNTFTGTQTVYTYYLDADGDGYGDPLKPFDYCFQYSGYVTNNLDCDDQNYNANPDMVEVCNGFDDDCNGLVDAADPFLTEMPPLGILCPDNMVVNNDPGVCSAQLTYLVTTDDNCGFKLEQTKGLTSGALFPFGSTENTYMVSDPAGNQVSCSFTVTVQKTADPTLAYAYTAIGFNDVYMKTNTVASGGVGVVGANKKARFQMGTTVTVPNTFVKAPIIDLQSGSLVTNALIGQFSAAALPAFKANNSPTNNNINIPNNSSPVTLSGNSYGNVVVGINATVTFSGQSTVLIKELTLKDGARVIFEQSTDLMVNKGVTIAKNVIFNPGGTWQLQCFAGGNVTVDRGSNISSNVYTLKDLRLEKATQSVPTQMTGLFIATNIYSREFVVWNWNANDCPQNKPSNLQERVAASNLVSRVLPGQLRIAPNPASESAQLTFELEAASTVQVQVMDAAGRVVHQAKFAAAAGGNQYLLALGQMSDGVYVVQLLVPGEFRTARLLVLRP